MLRSVAFSVVALFLAACSSKPLTETECKMLTNIEVNFATEGAGEDAEDMKRFLADAAEGAVAKCVAGKTYNRSDYTCLTGAKTRSDKGECFSAATARIGQ